MAKGSERTRALDGLQSVVGIVGITLGVIPLGRLIVTGETGGLFRWVLDSFGETLGFMAPMLVIVASVGVIAVLEMMKSRG